MKIVHALMVAAGLVVVGCEGKSPPGGPGAPAPGSREANTPRVTQPDNSFQLDAPNLETSIKQGETKTVSVGISRGKNFDQDVKLDFGDVPQGVKVKAAESAIKASAKEVQVTIEASKDAALGHHTVKVTGTPAKDGANTSTTLKIEVKKP